MISTVFRAFPVEHERLAALDRGQEVRDVAPVVGVVDAHRVGRAAAPVGLSEPVADRRVVVPFLAEPPGDEFALPDLGPGPSTTPQ